MPVSARYHPPARKGSDWHPSLCKSVVFFLDYDGFGIALAQRPFFGGAFAFPAPALDPRTRTRYLSDMLIPTIATLILLLAATFAPGQACVAFGHEQEGNGTKPSTGFPRLRECDPPE